jgi:hypothetical protein
VGTNDNGQSVQSGDLLADLVIVEKLARLAPELNPSNYNHDDVCRLNAAMCELYEVVRKYRPEANTKLSFQKGAKRVKDKLERLVGFRHLAKACAKQGRLPTCCYHPNNPGKLGMGGGRCVKLQCPVWDAIEEANAQIEARRE